MEFKSYIVLFLLFLLVRSKPFINNLSKINGTINSDGTPNNYGIILQGIVLVIAYMLMEVLVEHGYV